MEMFSLPWYDSQMILCSFIFVAHDDSKAILCKRFGNADDSFESNMKRCTTSEDPHWP